MRRIAKAPSAGSTQRQATGLGRIFRGAFATPRGASSDANGRGAPSPVRRGAPSPVRALAPAGALRAPIVVAVMLAAIFVTFALAATPALAAKGWAFKETFGSAAKPEFANDENLAVDRSSGDLLVTDQGADEEQQITFSGFAEGDTFSLGNLPASCSAVSTDPIEYSTNGTTRRSRILAALGAKCGGAANFSGTTAAAPTITFLSALGLAPQALMSCAKETGAGSCSVAETTAGSHHGVKRFHPDGTPSDFAALGSNVIDGKGGADATPSAGTLRGFRPQIAVDNSGGLNDGNIYVANNNTSFDIFASDGTFLGRLTACGASAFLKSEGVTVGPDGDVYVSGGEVPGTDGLFGIRKFEPTAKPPVNSDCTATFTGLSLEHVVAGDGPTDGYIFVRNSSGNSDIEKRDAETGAVQYRFGQRADMSVDPVTGNLVAGGIDLGNSAVEYDVSGSTAGSVTVVSKLENAGSSVSGLAVAEGAEELYVARASTKLVEVWEEVPIPEATVGPPSVVSGAKATVTGTVNPEGVAVTECFFQYGKTTSYGSTAPCKESIPTDENDHQVTAQLTGMLAQGVTYHYRLVAKAATGQDVSGDETLKTADTFFTKAASDAAETEATLNGTVRSEGVALTDCSFEYGKTTEYGQKAPCNPHFSAIPNDDADHSVIAILSGLEPSTIYHYRLVAQNSLGQIVAKGRTFATQGEPGIEAQIASALGQSTATLQAQVNPYGSPTTYHFEWGTDETYGNRIPADHELVAGSGSEPVFVNAELSGLTSASGYHFRVVATSPKGTTEGPDHRFETLNQHGLPNNRAFELVTPVDKGTTGAVSSGLGPQDRTLRTSEDGDSFLWPLENGVPESSAGGWARWRADRTDSGWLSTQVSGPSLIPPPRRDHLGFVDPSIVANASADLSCGLLRTFNPITEDTPQQSIELGLENLYLWRTDGTDVNYELVTDRVPLNPEANPVSGLYTKIEGAEDCSRFYFKSVYELIAGASGLYEWDEGTLRDAGVLPDGTVGANLWGNTLPAGPAVPGGEVDLFGTARWNAVSPDGERLFFTAIANEGPSSGKPAVFMREDGVVVEISASETAVPTNGARFEAASQDGDVVFFRANYGIADTSSPGATNGACGPQGQGGGSETISAAILPIEAKRCDLYAYDVEAEELTDLSADANPADPIGAAIQGTVAIDEDGSHVYFAALGQLVPGEGRTYSQNIAGDGSANVYLAEGGELFFVATLRRGRSASQLGGGKGDQDLTVGALMRTDNQGGWTAETTPDGSRLLFESTDNLTGYDSGGGKVAYLYDAGTGEVSCVSCRPDGKPTLVGPDGQFHGGRLDEPKLLHGPGRSMSEDGSRVFFTSPDVLMPGAVAGKRNVYEWEEGQLYFLAAPERADGFFLSPPASYLDAGASGDSAFLATNEQLAPQDRDFITDVYAVRVDGGFPLLPEPPDCQVDEGVALLPNQIYCQGDRTPQPPAPGPASAAFQGPGNPPESEDKPNPRACPKGKVKRRGKCVKRPKRAAKRKRGRAANSNRGGVK